jgi:hypothetical protein
METLATIHDLTTIEGFKLFLKGQVDKQTANNIMAGFSFGGGVHVFSMSLTAQINWSNFPSLPETLFPLTIMDKNDVPYVLSFADKMNFWGAALTHKNTALQAGTIKKAEIDACTTLTQLQTIADTL